MSQPLQDLRILVIEDESLLIHELTVRLEEAGAIALGPCASADRALEFLDGKHTIDLAILDLNLNGEPADTVADALRERGIPFVITSGYKTGESNDRYEGVPHFDKPVYFPALFDALARTAPGQLPAIA